MAKAEMATIAKAEKPDSQVQAAETSLLEQAVEDGCKILNELIDCKDDNDSDDECPTRSPHFPQFLPRAQALIFLKGVKMGAFVAGVQHASGFIVKNTNGLGGVCGHTGRAVWSAPCFVKAAGVQVGVVGGVEQVHALVGVLSEEALHNIMEGRKVTLGAGWGLALWPLGADSWQLPLSSDVAVARVGRGFMVNIGLESSILLVDHTRNAACYGRCASPAAILGGSVPPSAAMQPLLMKLRECSCAAVAASFEPAWHRHRSTSLD